MKPIIYDTETTGLPDWKEPSESPQQPHLVEIAAPLFDGTTEVDRFHAIIRPDGWDIPEEVAKIHGITMERAMDEGIPEAEAIWRFLCLHERADMRVAHNESFDARILRIALKRYGNGSAAGHLWTQEQRDAFADQFKAAPAYCTMRNTHAIAKAAGVSMKWPATMQEAHKHFLGQTFDGAHGALADAEACARVYFALTTAQAA